MVHLLDAEPQRLQQRRPEVSVWPEDTSRCRIHGHDQGRSGHTVHYDRSSSDAIRMVHIAGTLSFTRAKDTRLDVGLIKIGGDTSEDGFNCLHGNLNPRPALEVGTADDPIPAGRKALIRLVYFDGLDKETFPSIVCCGGRMDLHGAELSRTWVKLGAPATKGDTEIALSEPVTGWKA